MKRLGSLDELKDLKEKFKEDYTDDIPSYLKEYLDEEEQRLLRTDFFVKKALKNKYCSKEEKRLFKANEEEEFWEENDSEIIKAKKPVKNGFEVQYEQPPLANQRVEEERDLTPEEKSALKEMCRNDLYLFAIRYFPHYLKRPSSRLHKFLYRTLATEVNKHPNGVRWAIAAPRANAKCQEENSLVQLLDGSLKKIKDVSVGDELLGFGIDYKLIKTKVLAKEKSGQKLVRKIVFRSGRYIEASEDHRFYSLDTLVEVRDLKLGDKLATPRKIDCTVNSNTLTDADAIFLVNMLAEGCIVKNGSTQKIGYTNFDEEVVFDFANACDKLGFEVGLTGRFGQYNIKKCQKYLRKFGLAGTNSHTKFIPEEVFKQNDDFLKLFISRFFATDGWVSAYNLCAGITLANENLIDQLFTILLRLGFLPYKYNRPNEKYGAWSVCIYGIDDLVRLKNIGILHKQEKLEDIIYSKQQKRRHSNYDTVPIEWKKYLQNLTPHFLRKLYKIRVDSNEYSTSRTKLERVANLDNNETLKNLARSDIYWDEIIEISEPRFAETYDIQVDNENSSFIVNNIFSHNSALVSAIFPLWCICYEKKRFIIMLSNTASQVEDFIADIKRELEYNVKLREDFPHVCNKGPMWRTNEIVTNNYVKLLGLGTGNQVRGRRFGVNRPDLIICHKKGTDICTDDKWMKVEDHPTAKEVITDGYEVKVWGLPVSETVTKEHRYFVKEIVKKNNKNNDLEPEWKEAKDLTTDYYRIKHYIGYPIDYSVDKPQSIDFYKPIITRNNKGQIIRSEVGFEKRIPEEFYDKDFWWLVGLWWGDGYSSGKNQLNITFNVKDIESLEKAKSILIKFGRSYSLDYKYDEGCVQLIFCWSVFARWLKSWRVGNSKKKPPQWVEKIDFEYQKALIQGYIASDGFVDYEHSQIRITSVYLEGLLTVRRILMRLGIPCSIRDGIEEGEIEIKGRKVYSNKKYDLRFRDNAELLGYKIENQTRYKYSKTFIKDGYLWCKVRSKKEIKNETFVPITTKDHTYITHFGLSHNCDDLEDREMVISETQRHSIRHEWFNKDVLFAGGEEGTSTDFFIVGTILGKDSLLNNLLNPSEYPDWKSHRFSAVYKFSTSPLWDIWAEAFRDTLDEHRKDNALKFFENNKEEMLEGTEVLWPEGDPYYNLMVYRLTNPSGFAAEKQNSPVDPSAILIPYGMIKWKYFSDIAEIQEVLTDRRRGLWFGALDPSLGKKSKSGDYAVICTLVRDIRTGTIFVVDFICKRWSVEEQIDAILDAHKKHNYRGFAIETNAFQYVVAQNLRKRSKERGIYVPIQEIQQYQDKKMRIEGIVPFIADGTMMFDMDKYKKNQQYILAIDQITSFTGIGDEHDDAPDSLEMAFSIAKSPRFKMLSKQAKEEG